MRWIILFLALLTLVVVYTMAGVSIGGGFIRDTGTGGLFRVNTTSTTETRNGEISVSYEDSNPAVWVWIGGDRYQFTLTLNNPVADYLLLETGDKILLEDGTLGVVLE